MKIKRMELKSAIIFLLSLIIIIEGIIIFSIYKKFN